MYTKKENPIAEQSRQWLIESLLILMEKEDFTKITISEITKQADLSRITFYRLFDSKEEVLEQYFYQICDEYMGCFDNNKCIKLSDIYTIFFTFWERHISFLQLMEKNHLLYYLLEKLNQFIPEIHAKANPNSVEYQNEFEMKIALLINVGALWNIVPIWINLSQRPNPGEMAEIMIHAIQCNL